MSMYDSIILNMSEGLMTIGFDGVITHINPAAFSILGLKDDNVVGQKFAMLFFDSPGKDEFVQTILEAVYDKDVTHHAIVPYKTDEKMLHLRVMTSFYSQDDKKKGIIVVFSDLSELMELRDSVKSMEKIQALNRKLEMRNALLSETFGRFLSDEIVAQLLDTPGGLMLGGRKRELTIMMSDLRGFTAMSEQMEASDLISMLNHYLGCMTEIIQEHRGTIIEFIGDGIMAVFGAPTKSLTHAADAIAAAVSMQNAMEEINIYNKENGYPHLEMGIGLNTGAVIVGNIGSQKRTKYGVVGKHVNLCGRIESYTIGGQVLIPDSTRESAGIKLQVADTMKVYPKGINDGLMLYYVTGIDAPYNIYMQAVNYDPKPLASPIPVGFHMLEGKHGNEELLSGELTALSHDCAVLKTGVGLEVFDNLQLDCGGSLFCKVVKKETGSFLIKYTSVPPGYEQWVRSFPG